MRGGWGINESKVEVEPIEQLIYRRAKVARETYPTPLASRQAASKSASHWVSALWSVVQALKSRGTGPNSLV